MIVACAGPCAAVPVCKRQLPAALYPQRVIHTIRSPCFREMRRHHAPPCCLGGEHLLRQSFLGAVTSEGCGVLEIVVIQGSRLRPVRRCFCIVEATTYPSIEGGVLKGCRCLLDCLPCSLQSGKELLFFLLLFCQTSFVSSNLIVCHPVGFVELCGVRWFRWFVFRKR